MRFRTRHLAARLQQCWFSREKSIFRADRATYHRVESRAAPSHLGQSGDFHSMGLGIGKYVSVSLSM